MSFLEDYLESAPAIGKAFLPPAFIPLNLLDLFSTSKTYNPSIGDPKISDEGPTPGVPEEYYAGKHYEYQSPDSYKKIFGAYPPIYRNYLEAKLEENKKEDEDNREKNRIEIGSGKEGKFYAGEDYGYQSGPSYKKIFGDFPPNYVPPKPAPSKEGPKTSGEGSTNMIDATSKPVLDIPKLSSELREAQIAEKEKDFLRQQQIASLYARDALEKSRLNTQRQVELENIKAWRDITQTQIEAQTRSAALTASLLTALQQPNVNFMNALSDAFNAGAAPFSARVRIRG
jgi:hypothetical protein